MKIRSTLRHTHYLKVVGIVLIVAALVVGVMGCPTDPKPDPEPDPGPAQYSLTVSSSLGGVVTAPGQDTFTFEEGAVVSLVAEADEGYEFVSWSGDVGTVADPEAPETTITMNGDYSITAGFREVSGVVSVWDWYDLDGIRDDLAGHYVLMNDLDSTSPGYKELASATANEGRGWEPIGAYNHSDPGIGFTGHLDGNGYEMKDLIIDRPDEDGVGLFGLLDEGGLIKDIGVTDAQVTGGRFVGGLGGVNLGGTVSNCYSSAVVAGEGIVGGMLGWNRGGTLINSYSSGTVTAHRAIGGLVGAHAWGTVRNSHYNYDEVLINGVKMITIGALYDEDFTQWLGSDRFLDVNERLSHDDGYYLIYDVSDFKHLLVFGQDGSLGFSLKNDLDLGNDPNFFIPYLAGEFNGNGHKISNLSLSCDSVALVGLFGYLASGGIIIQTGVESLEVTGGHVTGGLVGWSEGTVSDSYAVGSVTGVEEVGGLVGTNCGTVSRSYSGGTVAGGWEIGGLVGYNYRATISNSYSTSSVAGDDRTIGGLVGVNSESTVSNCYSVGNVSGERRVGGLAGYNNAFISDSFWDTETSGMDESAGGTGKTTAEMRDIATFADTTTEGLDQPWDIAPVNPGEINPAYTWNIVDGQAHPFLSWQSVG